LSGRGVGGHSSSLLSTHRWAAGARRFPFEFVEPTCLPVFFKFESTCSQFVFASIESTNSLLRPSSLRTRCYVRRVYVLGFMSAESTCSFPSCPTSHFPINLTLRVSEFPSPFRDTLAVQGSAVVVALADTWLFHRGVVYPQFVLPWESAVQLCGRFANMWLCVIWLKWFCF
jgi:hypothetical protein